MELVQLRHLRFLELSAASGLILLNETFYVIADDELELHGYPKNLTNAIRKIQLIQGQLPEEPHARKSLKPDFESLVHLPMIDSILAVPSGSTSRRTKGVLVNGGLKTEINFEPLFQALTGISDLNIEGTVIVGDAIKLFHRGNGAGQQNAIINLNLKIFIEDIQLHDNVTARSLREIENCDLGELNGQKLSFTDAATESADRIWYLAVVEGGNSTYLDGDFGGAVIGCINSKNEIICERILNCPAKPEGLALDIPNKKFYVVTDPDNRSHRSQLFEGDLFYDL